MPWGSYNARVPREQSDSLSARPGARLQQAIARAMQQAGGWLPFDRFMALALYAPGLGYYARDDRQFGEMPASGSDFVTAPEMTPLFGAALARQVGQALLASGTDEVFEFGAGSGALAEQLLEALGEAVRGYRIVEVSGALAARQRQRLARFGGRVQWLSELPPTLRGVVVGNEVLDAMPVQLLHFDGQRWWERGVRADGEGWAWVDRPTTLHPPVDGPFLPGTVTEIHPQAQAFVRTLAERMPCGAAFFLDYGFPEREYYHPQRHGGTLVCHRAHRVDADPLGDVGEKDITAHVDFTGIALAAQEAGFEVAGYTSQARFLANCGLLELAQGADARTLAAVNRLLAEHEMGELFKVIALLRGVQFEPLGFTAGDRTHTL